MCCVCVCVYENSKFVVTKSSFAMMRVAAFETVIYVLNVCVCVCLRVCVCPCVCVRVCVCVCVHENFEICCNEIKFCDDEGRCF